MIKNLVVSGCSFTSAKFGWQQQTFAAIQTKFDINLQLANLAKAGAGNFYIADSLTYFLSKNNFDPAETLVIVMWSGVNRKDIPVSKEFYDLIIDTFEGIKINDLHYLISGGQIGSWQSEFLHPRGKTYRWLIRPVFENLYKSSDEFSMAHSTLTNIFNTKNFLENKGYPYRFMSYVNYWNNLPDPIVSDTLDFNIPYYAPDHPLLNKLGDNWIWTDDKKNCLYEYAKQRNLLADDNFHPNKECHKEFTDNIIMPSIERIFK